MIPQPYTPYVAPRKEGWHRRCVRQRRRNALRLITVALVIAGAYIVFSQPSSHAQSSPAERLPHRRFGRAVPEAEPISNSNSRPVAPVEALNLPEPAPVEQRASQSALRLDPLNEPKAPRVQPEGSRVRHEDLIKSKDEDDSRLQAALQHVLLLLPDEIHVREMLRPLEGTGKEKLRDVGLRARAYKAFFEAWESLHLVTDFNATYIRDDIVQYLRKHEGVANLAQTLRSYEAYRSFLHRLASLLFPWTMPYFSDHMSLHAHVHRGGRGIVFTAGDNQAPYLLTSIASFRRLGCELPIEIMYLGDSDLSEDYRAELEMLPGVVTRDLSQMVNDDGWTLAGWAAKPFAILLSSFREVIFIDADALFLRNPEILFEEPSYVETGALFFKDRIIMPESKKRWLQQVLQKPISRQVRQNRFWTGESGHMQESGVVVVDKWRHFVAMLMVTRMNGPDRDGNEQEHRIGVYDMLYGDKETFWIGWELVGDVEYSFHRGSAGILGKIEPRKSKGSEKKEDGDDDKKSEEQAADEPDVQELDLQSAPSNFTICAPQLLHLDTDGRPLWFNGWLLDNKFADKKKRAPAVFEAYLIEPPDPAGGEDDAWKLEENNICCLTSNEFFGFSETEKETLDMISGIAKDVGAYGKR